MEANQDHKLWLFRALTLVLVRIRVSYRVDRFREGNISYENHYWTKFLHRPGYLHGFIFFLLYLLLDNRLAVALHQSEGSADSAHRVESVGKIQKCQQRSA